MSASRRVAGVSIAELLIVTVILGILLSLLTVFFSSQARTTQRTQAINEVEVKVRTAAEVMTQDLQMAGSRSVMGEGGTVYVDKLQAYCSALKGSTSPCIIAPAYDSEDEPRRVFTVYYATSLRAKEEEEEEGSLCRRVDYELTDDERLQRSDVGCSDEVKLQPFADNVPRVGLEFTCSNDDVVKVPADCYSGDHFPEQASIALHGTSENTREGAEATVTLSTTTRNMRPVAVSE